MDIFTQIATWNYVREHTQFNERLEYNMMDEELTEVLESTNDANLAKEIADVIFVAVGSLYKLAGSEDKAREIMQVVINHNNLKGLEKDEDGKVKKTLGVPPCEPDIARILG